MEKQILKKLNSREYEHPLDREALNKVRNSKGFDSLLRKVNQYSTEKIQGVVHSGSFFKVTEKSLPKLNKLFEESCRILDIDYKPNLYITQDPMINAYALGANNPMIVLTTGSLERLSTEELFYLLGHELGHIKSGHTAYLDLQYILPRIGNVVGSMTFGLGRPFVDAISYSLNYWSRMGELTCDRAGFLCCQDFDVVISALAKMAGFPSNYATEFNKESFLDQANSFEELDKDSYSKIIKFGLIVQQTHPWPVMRAKEINKWSEEYNKLLTLHTKGNIEDIKIPCIYCRGELQGDEEFCPNCGKKVFM